MASTHCVFRSYCYGWCMPSVVVSVAFYFNHWIELFVLEIMLCVRTERIRRWLFDLFHECSVSITRSPFLFRRSSGGWKWFVHNFIISHFYWFHYYSLVSIFRILSVICAFFLWQKMQSFFVWRKIDTTIIQQAIGVQNVTNQTYQHFHLRFIKWWLWKMKYKKIRLNFTASACARACCGCFPQIGLWFPLRNDVRSQWVWPTIFRVCAN